MRNSALKERHGFLRIHALDADAETMKVEPHVVERRYLSDRNFFRSQAAVYKPLEEKNRDNSGFGMRKESISKLYYPL
jgi:hypothetical protein